MLPADVHEHDGDVVGGAAVEGLLEQVVCRAAGGEIETHRLEDVCVVDDAGESVGAEQPAVAGERRHHEEVELRVVVHVAEHAHEHRAAGVEARLFRGDAPGVDETLHEGVVGGDLRQLVVAVEVDARIADVTDDGVVIDHDDRADGGAEPGELGAILGGADEVAGGGCRGGLEGRLRVIRGREGLVEPLELLDGDGGCHVAAGVTAHAVGDGEQVRAGVAGVLVVGPDLPGVGDRGA